MEIYTTGISSSPTLRQATTGSLPSTKNGGLSISTNNDTDDRSIASHDSTFSQLWSKKPFVMPSDEKVLGMRSLEKIKLREKQKIENLLPVSEKQTFTSKLSSIKWSDELKQDMADIDAKIAKEMEKMRSVTILPVEHYHKERENMAQFISKKREIFLIQMTLDTKRSEIRKLEDKIFQREEALRKSEEMLKEDSVEFDNYLKKNDEKVQESIRKADQQTRLKQDKVAEAKRLNNSINALKRDHYKFKEQLDECRKYKEFIINITPKEWLEEQSSIVNTALEDTTSEEGSEVEMAEKMYFDSPSQLLEIFNSLEEKNLTLMQDCQENETALEALRAKFRETQARNDAKIANLRTQFSALKTLLKNEEECQTSLQNKTILNNVDRKHEFTSEDIVSRVAEVYARCGFDIDPSLGVIQMLTNIEARLEENVIALGEMMIPNDYVEHTEKSREKERRLDVRAERLERVRDEQEKRAMRSLARAQAPVHKRIGKPIMFRSLLPARRRREVTDAGRGDDDKDLTNFLFRTY